MLRISEGIVFSAEDISLIIKPVLDNSLKLYFSLLQIVYVSFTVFILLLPSAYSFSNLMLCNIHKSQKNILILNKWIKS